MPKLALTPDELLVQLSPFESVLALHASLRIPLSCVCTARQDDAIRQSGFGLRAPGTGIPFLLSAGTYRQNGEVQFVFVTRTPGIVVIDLKNQRFARIILALQDAAGAAAMISRAVAPSEARV